MHPDLHQAIQRARERGEAERVLRLLIQNVPRYPNCPVLRLVAAQLLTGSDDDLRGSLLHASFEAAVRTGDCLTAVAAIRLVERHRAQDGPEMWERLFESLDARAMSPTPPAPPSVEPETDGDRPPLPLEGLASVLAELVAHLPEPETPPPFARAPLLHELSPESLRWLLLRLDLAEPVDGQPLVGGETGLVGWLLWGGVLHEEHALRFGLPSLVLASEAIELSAHGPSLLLVPRREASDEIAAHPLLRAALDQLALRRALVRYGSTSGFSAALNDANAAAESLIEIVALLPGESLPGSHAAYALTLRGTPQCTDAAGAPVPLTPGEWFRPGRDEALSSRAEATLAIIPRFRLGTLPPPLIDWLDRHAHTRHSSAVPTDADLSSLELADDDLL